MKTEEKYRRKWETCALILVLRIKRIRLHQRNNFGCVGAHNSQGMPTNGNDLQPLWNTKTWKTQWLRTRTSQVSHFVVFFSAKQLGKSIFSFFCKNIYFSISNGISMEMTLPTRANGRSSLLLCMITMSAAKHRSVCARVICSSRVRILKGSIARRQRQNSKRNWRESKCRCATIVLGRRRPTRLKSDAANATDRPGLVPLRRAGTNCQIWVAWVRVQNNNHVLLKFYYFFFNLIKILIKSNWNFIFFKTQLKFC